MAKLKPANFSFTSQSGEVLSFQSEVSVSDSSGEFSMTIPDELEQTATVVATNMPMFKVTVERPRRNLRVTGDTLAACKSFIDHVGQDYLKCDVTEELVVVYGVDNKVAYVKDTEGRLYPNGNFCDRKDFDSGRARWQGTLHATNMAEYFQVGLVARVLKKVTYSRPSGKRVVYLRLPEAEMPHGSWLTKLNAFCGVGLPYRNGGYQLSASHREMPYTEEAAKFFHDTMMTMCVLADRITNFFGDTETLKLAIQNQAGLLPAPQHGQG